MSDPDDVRLGPLPGEQFSQTIRRLAHELYGVTLEEHNRMPGTRKREQDFQQRLDAIWRKAEPGDREPGEDREDEAV